MYVHVVVLLGVLRQREVTSVGMKVVAGQGTRPAAIMCAGEGGQEVRLPVGVVEGEAAGAPRVQQRRQHAVVVLRPRSGGVVAVAAAVAAVVREGVGVAVGQDGDLGLAREGAVAAAGQRVRALAQPRQGARHLGVLGVHLPAVLARVVDVGVVARVVGVHMVPRVVAVAAAEGGGGGAGVARARLRGAQRVGAQQRGPRRVVVDVAQVAAARTLRHRGTGSRSS